MAQPRIARTDRSKDAGGAIAILNAGFVHDESDQVALGVGNDVALAALDLSPSGGGRLVGLGRVMCNSPYGQP